MSQTNRQRQTVKSQPAFKVFPKKYFFCAHFLVYNEDNVAIFMS